jgi:DNA-binding MarR family transcriptional regulator
VRHAGVVRVVPGVTSDRRDTVGHGSKSFRDPSIAEVKDGDGGPMPSALSFPPDRSCSSLATGSGRESHPFEAAPMAALSFRDTMFLLHELGRHGGAYGALSKFYFCGPSPVYDVRKQLGLGQQAVEGVISVLLQLKLIETEPTRPFPYTRSRSYRLTARGRSLMETPMCSWSALLKEWSCV